MGWDYDLTMEDLKKIPDEELAWIYRFSKHHPRLSGAMFALLIGTLLLFPLIYLIVDILS